MVKCEICRYSNQRDPYSSHCVKCTDYSQFKAITNLQKIKEMTREEIAKIITEYQITDKFCHANCQGDDCLNSLECCLKWLDEEATP